MPTNPEARSSPERPMCWCDRYKAAGGGTCDPCQIAALRAQAQALEQTVRDLAVQAWNGWKDTPSEHKVAEGYRIIALQLAERDIDLKQRTRKAETRVQALTEENERLKKAYTELDKNDERMTADLATCRQERHEAEARLRQVEAERDHLREVCNESNAVCVCGCPVGDHENYGEDGEACQHDAHECIRTSKAVYTIVHRLRARLTTLATVVREVEQEMNNCREWYSVVGKTIRNWRDKLRAALPKEGQP